MYYIEQLVMAYGIEQDRILRPARWLHLPDPRAAVFRKKR